MNKKYKSYQSPFKQGQVYGDNIKIIQETSNTTKVGVKENKQANKTKHIDADIMFAFQIIITVRKIAFYRKIEIITEFPSKNDL